MPLENLCAVVLSAGEGRRLRPLTLLRPKALCPVGNTALLDHALRRVRNVTDDIAVNAYWLAGQVVEHLAGRVQVSVEPASLGTAGAIGNLKDWIDGRPVLVHNADAFLPAGLTELLDGWSGEHSRLLVKQVAGPADFGPLRYVGAALLPASTAASLPAEPSGLYETLWGNEHSDGFLEFARYEGEFVDCGTPDDYLAANMLVSGGETVIGAGAVVNGQAERCVLWPGTIVNEGEHLVDAIRASDAITVQC